MEAGGEKEVVGEWSTLLLPVSRECFFDMHFPFKIKYKSDLVLENITPDPAHLSSEIIL